MAGPFLSLRFDNNGIAYTPYSYVSGIYAAVRSDIDKSSNAYKLFEYLITASGQKVVKESGYVPIDNQR